MASRITLDAELTREGLHRLAVDVGVLLRAYGVDLRVLVAALHSEAGTELDLEPAQREPIRERTQEAEPSPGFTEQRWGAFISRVGGRSLDFLKACARLGGEFRLVDVAGAMGAEHKEVLAFNRNIHRSANKVGLPLFNKSGGRYSLLPEVAHALSNLDPQN